MNHFIRFKEERECHSVLIMGSVKLAHCSLAEVLITFFAQVPFFSQMDDQLLDAICERLVSSLSTQGTFIVREGDPVNEMIFIIRGTLESSTTNGGRTGFYNSITLRPGDFCGEELLTWALMPTSSLHLPSSTRTVRALTEVEAFALQAEDLKFVAHQFKRLHSKRLQHAFRYYSHQWRTWGACFIQSAWRRHKQRKLAEELFRQENGLYTQLLNQEGYPSSQTAEGNRESVISGRPPINNASSTQNPRSSSALASKFAASIRREASRKIGVDDMPQLFKPQEPDFSAYREDV